MTDKKTDSTDSDLLYTSEDPEELEKAIDAWDDDEHRYQSYYDYYDGTVDTEYGQENPNLIDVQESLAEILFKERKALSKSLRNPIVSKLDVCKHGKGWEFKPPTTMNKAIKTVKSELQAWKEVNTYTKEQLKLIKDANKLVLTSRASFEHVKHNLNLLKDTITKEEGHTEEKEELLDRIELRQHVRKQKMMIVINSYIGDQYPLAYCGNRSKYPRPLPPSLLYAIRERRWHT